MVKRFGQWTRVALLLLMMCGAAAESRAQQTRYAATLGAIAGSAGSGRADFTFDDLGLQLTYTILYDAMPGAVTEAYMAGPQQGDVLFTTVPPAPGPIGGTTTLTDAQAALLKGGKLFVGVKSSANGSIGGWIAPK
jgi:hypothetical protein